MTPAEYALAYAAIGWHVFPLLPGVKRPHGALAPRGHLNATTDEATIRDWWARCPDAGIGVAMQPSRLVAIDIDPRNGGHFTLEQLEAEHGRLEADVLAYTGGGGLHLVFTAPTDIGRLPGKLAKGIDLKADGYIAVEPTFAPQADPPHTKPYSWEASSNPLDGAVPSPLPGWIADLARAPAVSVSGPVAPSAARPLAEHELADIRAALASIPADERQTWVTVGMALHRDVGGALGFELWCAWSQTCPEKFDPQDQQRVWRSFTRKPMGEAVQLGTLFDLAQRHGYRRAAATIVVPDAPHSSRAPQPAAASSPDDLLTIPGMLGEAVHWINSTARKPQPLFAVQAALALGSAAMGRRFRTDNGNWTALYLLNIGPSGSGKEHAKHCVERALESAGLAHLIGAGRFASESGVLSALVEKPAQFSTLDEFGKMLQGAAQVQNFVDRNTLKFLMETWGRADGVLRPVAYSTAGLSSKQAEELARRCVRKPSLTLLALSTPETLFGGLTTSAVADGFLNRFLTVHSDRGRQLARTVADVEPPQAVVDWLREVGSASPGGGNMAGFCAPHDMEPTPVVIPFDPGALSVFAAFEASLHHRMNDLDAEGLAEMLTRTTETAMRVSLIVATSCRHTKILRQDAQWACDYVLHHAERNLEQLRDHLSDGAFDQLCKEILRLVLRAGKRGMTERDINTSCRSWRAAQSIRIRDDALKSLERRGEISLVEIVSATGRGRKRFAWVSSELVSDEAISMTNADISMTACQRYSEPKVH